MQARGPYALALGVLLVPRAARGQVRAAQAVPAGLGGFTVAPSPAGSPAVLIRSSPHGWCRGRRAPRHPAGVGILGATRAARADREGVQPVRARDGAVRRRRPVLAGFLIDADLGGLGWRAVFLINIVLGWCLRRRPPAARGPRREGHRRRRGRVRVTWRRPARDAGRVHRRGPGAAGPRGRAAAGGGGRVLSPPSAGARPSPRICSSGPRCCGPRIHVRCSASCSSPPSPGCCTSSLFLQSGLAGHLPGPPSPRCRRPWGSSSRRSPATGSSAGSGGGRCSAGS